MSYRAIIILLSICIGNCASYARAPNGDFEFGEVLGRYFGSIIYIDELSKSSCPSSILKDLKVPDIEAEKKSILGSVPRRHRAEVREFLDSELWEAKIRYDAREVFSMLEQQAFEHEFVSICQRLKMLYTDENESARASFYRMSQ